MRLLESSAHLDGVIEIAMRFIYKQETHCLATVCNTATFLYSTPSSNDGQKHAMRMVEREGP